MSMQFNMRVYFYDNWKDIRFEDLDDLFGRLTRELKKLNWNDVNSVDISIED